MNTFWRSGSPFIWLAGLTTAAGLLMIAALIGLILANGLGIFWPARLAVLTLRDGSKLMGEIRQREGIIVDHENPAPAAHRIRLKTGNRDIYGLDFRWVDENDIQSRAYPDSAFVLERRAWGNFFGYITGLKVDGTYIARGAGQVATALDAELQKAHAAHAQIYRLEKDVIGETNYQLERFRLEKKRLSLRSASESATAARVAKIDSAIAGLERAYAEQEKKLVDLNTRGRAYEIELMTADGQTKSMFLMDVVRAYQPNRLSVRAKARLYLARAWEFLADEPREANTEGGVFPAIFGTVLMVIIMSIVVVPLGVLTAVYLREYAKQGLLVRAVRIAVNNLAGVPSIVFGIFGLGFFVYAVGGTIDQLFFPEALPSPTYGTGGILWASLTLALLTVPVVIVATEEGLAAVPRQIREGSAALGATKFETLWRIILPSASPAILTGTILAIARAAGEVAPLMVTGVVKLAPTLPLDGHFPFLHLDRKFMHLGFHIYDVGFQSPNVEASLPMVYAATLLLILIVIALNLAAILLRSHLRKKFAVGKI